MATFKIGQRVRIDCPQSKMHGKTGVIWNIHNDPIWIGPCGGSGTAYSVDIDGVGRRWPNGACFGYEAHDLRPLTDPAADAFIERLKKLGREPVNTVEKVTV